MDTTKIETYLLVCKKKSFTKAADKLFISPAAVKKQIDSLEDEVGVKLVHRSSLGTIPTPAGIVFQEYARSILRTVHQAIEAAQQEDRIQFQNFNIGHSVKLGYGFISDTLNGFSKHYPSQSIRFNYLHKSELLSSLQNELINCFLFINPQKKDFLDIPNIVVGTTNIHAVLHHHHPLAHRDTISLNDLLLYDVYVSSVLDQELYDSLEAANSARIHVLDLADRNDLAVSLQHNAIFLYPCRVQHDISIPFEYPPLEIRLYYIRRTPVIDELHEILSSLLISSPNQILL